MIKTWFLVIQTWQWNKGQKHDVHIETSHVDYIKTCWKETPKYVISRCTMEIWPCLKLDGEKKSKHDMQPNITWEFKMKLEQQLVKKREKSNE
jgi:hypothetical protein